MRFDVPDPKAISLSFTRTMIRKLGAWSGPTCSTIV
jgi:hypothetical protein